MRQIPVLSGFFDYLTAPRFPRTSLSISETHLALITLKRSGRDFEPRNLGVSRLPAGLVRASFTEPNITDEAALRTLFRQEDTGDIRGWVVSLQSPAMSERPAEFGTRDRVYHFLIRGYMGMKDGVNTEGTFLTMTEAILDVIDTQTTFGVAGVIVRA